MRHLHIIAGAALALAACGSGEKQEDAATAPGASTTASAKTDPCSLVTAQEIGAIIGDEVVAAKPGDGSCTYETADAQASSVTIELDQQDAAGKMDVARRAAGALADLGSQAAAEGGAAGADLNAMMSDSGDAPKIGDEAFFGANQELSIRKGASYIAISPPMMRSRMASGSPLLSSADKKKMAVAIAEKAVTRLP